MAKKTIRSAGALQDINANFTELYASAGQAAVHSATAGEATAGEVVIDTGNEDATGFEVDIWRAGVKVTADAVVTLVDGVLTIANGGTTYDVTAGDKIHYRVF